MTSERYTRVAMLLHWLIALAVLMWLMTGGRVSFWPFWVYSNSIGMLSWLFIDGSRMLLVHHLGSRDAKRKGWPGLGWMLLCVMAGAVSGYALGTLIGDAITGYHSPVPFSQVQPVVMSLVEIGRAHV